LCPRSADVPQAHGKNDDRPIAADEVTDALANHGLVSINIVGPTP